MTDSKYFDVGSWSPFLYPVPVPGTLPSDAPRQSICINHDWIPYVVACLKALTRPESWAADPSTLQPMMQDLYGIISKIEDSCVSDIMFRQAQDCLAEYSLDGGTTWHPLVDIDRCIQARLKDGTLAPSSSQPQNIGSPGICQDLNVVVPASSAIAVGPLLSTGDTVQLSNIDIGPWIDSLATLQAYCSGGFFWSFPTGCGAGDPAHAGDPLLTANHMALIANIGGTYYNVSGGALVTVPPGVTDATLILQPNDGVLWDNLYSIAAKVTVCKVGWTHVFDFTLSNGGWAVDPVTSGIAGVWVNGVGWSFQDFFNAGSGNIRGIFIHSPVVAARDWLEIKIQYSVHGLATDQPLSDAWAYLVTPGGGTVIHDFNHPIDADHHIDDLFTGWLAATQMDLNILSSLYGGSATFAGSIVVEKITISGKLTDPF